MKKLDYLKSALKFVKNFSERTLKDKEKLEELVATQNETNERMQKRANTAREAYGKIFVFSQPHDSDNSDDEFDPDILASSSIADNESVATEGNDEEMAQD